MTDLPWRPHCWQELIFSAHGHCGAGLLRQLPAPHILTSNLLSAARELSQAFPDASGYRTPEPQARTRRPGQRCACLSTCSAHEALNLRRLLRLPETTGPRA